MPTYNDKQILNSNFKLNITSLNEVDWDNIPMTIGRFSVALVEKSGAEQKIEDVSGTLANVVISLQGFDPENFSHVNVIQLN
jgi:hypothetical protein